MHMSIKRQESKQILKSYLSREGFRTAEDLNHYGNIESIGWSLLFNFFYVLIFFCFVFSGIIIEPLVKLLETFGIVLKSPDASNMPEITMQLMGMIFLFMYLYAYVFRALVFFTQILTIKYIFKKDIPIITIWKTNVASTYLSYFGVLASLIIISFFVPAFEIKILPGLLPMALIFIIAGLLLIPTIYKTFRDIYGMNIIRNSVLTFAWVIINITCFFSLIYLIMFKFDVILWTLQKIINW